MKNDKQIKINDPASNNKKCINCNPQQYLKFCFSFAKEFSEPKREDKEHLLDRLVWLSQDKYYDMLMKYRADKSKWFETINIDQIKKDVPRDFREIFPSETNEKYQVLRIYPSGTPKGSANPRVIGMIKHCIFYIFYIDWDGKLYSHGNRKNRH